MSFMFSDHYTVNFSDIMPELEEYARAYLNHNNDLYEKAINLDQKILEKIKNEPPVTTKEASEYYTAVPHVGQSKSIIYAIWCDLLIKQYSENPPSNLEDAHCFVSKIPPGGEKLSIFQPLICTLERFARESVSITTTIPEHIKICKFIPSSVEEEYYDKWLSMCTKAEDVDEELYDRFDIQSSNEEIRMKIFFKWIELCNTEDDIAEALDEICDYVPKNCKIYAVAREKIKKIRENK